MRFLWTLTYKEEPADLATVKVHLRWFFRQVQRVFGGQPLVAVVEIGSERGRLHVHFGASRFLSIEGVRRTWRRGHVWVGDPRRLPGRVPVGQLARYLAKYLGKDADELGLADPKSRQDGQHRYHLAQGFQPEVIRGRIATAAKGLAYLMKVYGTPDVLIAWGEPREEPIFGYWAAFPEGTWWPPPSG